jgi:thiamine biosynthesis lipoprotein
VTASASFPALGTNAVVVVERSTELPRARALLAAQLDELDRTCSRFRADSELARANAQAGRPVQIGPLLVQAVAAALGAAHATDGLVDPTLGPQLRHAGYDRTFALVGSRSGWTLASRPPRRADWTEIELDAAAGVLRTPRGCELDLGATAKALGADRAALAIAEGTGCGVLVSLGGDIAVAGLPPAGGWCVRIADEHSAPLDAPGPVVSFDRGGLATSGTAVRRWPTDRGDAHHVLDPRTGAPARTPWRTVTVAAATCLDANVASTAAVVLGRDAADWLRHRGVPARLRAADGSVVHVGGWPAEAEAA